MISIPGAPGVHIWEPGELEARCNEARGFAMQLFPEEELWRTRVEALAIHLGCEMWAMVKTRTPGRFKALYKKAVELGYPGDDMESEKW